MNSPQKFLFIKLCCIGDVLFLTPAIRSVRQAYPDASITILASTWIKPIVERIPSVDEVIYFDAPFIRERSLKKITNTFGILRTLRNKNFTCAVVAHRSSFFSLLAFLAGIPRRIGFSDSRFLTESVMFDETIHETERYKMLTSVLTGPIRTKGMELKAKTEDKKFADTFIQEHSVSHTVRLIGIFPGGGDNPGTKMHIKRWYGVRYAELIRKLYKEHAVVPLFIGSGSDMEAVTPIISMIDGEIPYINAVHRPSLGQLTGLLSRCSIVIGGDSGPIHMAAALDVATVTIFGPSDPRLVAPLGPRHRYLWKQIECSPCYTPATVKEKKHFKGNEFVCITGTHACINGLSVDEVYKTIIELLQEDLSKDTHQ